MHLPSGSSQTRKGGKTLHLSAVTQNISTKQPQNSVPYSKKHLFLAYMSVG